MEKKTYFAPVIKAYHIKCHNICAASVTGEGDAKLGWGGSGNNKEADAKGASLFDALEEEEE